MKKLLYFLLGLVVLLLVVMLLLGKKYHFEKSIVINATPEKIYAHINSTKAFNQWNPWMKLDPNLKMEYTGTQGEIGDKYCWKSDVRGVGNGCQEITGLVPNQKQSTKMEFDGQGEATSDIILTPDATGTKVTWTMDTEMDYPSNLMKLFMNSMMDKSYGEGLASLKALSEKP